MHYSRSSLTKKQMWQKQIKCQGSVGVSESSSSEKLVDMQKMETEGETMKVSVSKQTVPYCNSNHLISHTALS